MKPISSTVIVSSFLLASIVAGFTACPSFAEENGIDFWNVGTYQRELEFCQQERGRLQIESEAAYQRLIIKEEIVKDLLEGRMSFEVAADQFVILNRTLSSSTEYFLLYPAKNEVERASRQLIAFLRARRIEQARSLADRIECKL